jgi:hypothetical protein
VLVKGNNEAFLHRRLSIGRCRKETSWNSASQHSDSRLVADEPVLPLVARLSAGWVASGGAPHRLKH